MIRLALDSLDLMVLDRNYLNIKRNKSVIIAKCEVKQARKGNKLEIM